MASDPRLKTYLLDIAAHSAGLSHDCSFGGFNDTRIDRAAPSWGADSDVRLALAGARDALLDALAGVHDRVIAGDPAVVDDYERWMRTLAGLVSAWAALHTGSA